MKGLRVGFEVGPLSRRRGSALAHGCARDGRVVLPLARAAAVSTGLRVRAGHDAHEEEEEDPAHADDEVGLGVLVRVGVGVRVGMP